MSQVEYQKKDELNINEKEISLSLERDDISVDRKEEDFVPSSMIGTVYNHICITAGSGLLVLPWSFSRVGLFPGMIACTLTCLMAAFTYILIGISAEQTQKYSWRAMWGHTISQKTAFLPMFASWLFIAISILIYLILTANFLEGAFTDLLPSLDSFFPLRQIILSGVSILFILPLSMLKDFTYLQYSSLIANLGLLYVMGILIFKNPEKSETYEMDYWKFSWGGIFSCISIQITSFGSHALGPQLYEELSERSPKRFAIVVGIGFFISWIITMTFGIAGYIAFGNNVNGDVMKSYPIPKEGIDWIIVIAKLILAINMIATQAIYYSALARETISLVAELNAHCKRDWMQKIEDFLKKHKRFVFIPFSIAIVLGLGLLFNKVEVLGEFVGATAGVWTIVLFPTLIYIYLGDRKFLIITWFLFIFGSLISILCFVQFILGQANVEI